MKVMFLDHDGVICLEQNWGSRFKKAGMSPSSHISRFDELSLFHRYDNFYRGAVGVVNSIIERTGCEIVISSDWRIWSSLEDLGEYYLNQGIIKKPIGYTPVLSDIDQSHLSDFNWSRNIREESAQVRSFEILDWLKNNKVQSWVAVDDMNMRGDSTWGLGGNFIWTPRSREGISQSGVLEKIVKILNR
jgi:hypothetical protein